ncbi:ribonuclease, putative [Bodo saltans]|uniref:Ribonuclease, putative n=1 Tax=Bodo saltans TaxID=75058 RepID=A0A0S4IR41_BODSA|nr:ribonuclease, putative [Bodo saltans]|eukprot:CUE75673.1 ribonuclease, putative [Bodo saltans]
MEINRANFSATFPKIQHLLQTCDFYAFDLEMTGINPVRCGRGVDAEAIHLETLPHNCRFYSTPEDSFAGKWEAATTFSPMQLGLSIFHKRSADATVATFRQKLTCRESSQVVDKWIEDHRRPEQALELAKATVQQLANAVNNLKGVSDNDDLSLEAMETISRFSLLSQELDAVTDFITSHSSSAPAAASSSPLSPSSNRGLDDYVATTFHCHLFPSFHYGDGELRMSIETVGTFLSEHNMDFNAWVRNSLLYAPREAVARERVEALRRSASKSIATGGPPAFNQEMLAKVPKTDLNLVTTAFAALELFAENNRDNKEARQTKALPYIANSDSFSAVIAKAKSLGLKADKGDIVWSPNPVDSANANGGGESAKHQANLLFEAMINSKKPAIAHNSWSDLLFLYRAFHSTPLTSYEHFKSTLGALFPTLYDTRTLSSLEINHGFGQVRGQLDRTYQLFKREHEARTVRVVMTDGFSEGSGAAHNAGYDAFITGSLFLYVSAEMRKHEGLTVELFNGVLPVYASIFSISLHTEHDYLVQARSAPVFYCVPGPGARGGIFADRVASIMRKANLPSIPMNCGDSALLFVIGSARGTGSLLNSSITAALRDVEKSLSGASVIDMKVDEFLQTTNGKIQFFPLGDYRQ